MAETTYKTMDISDLSDNATEKDLAWFCCACQARQGETEESDESVTAWMWGNGDWGTRCRQYVDPRIISGWSPEPLPE